MAFILLESRYNREKNRVELLFYNEETKELFTYLDKTQYKPYFYTTITREKMYLLQKYHLDANSDEGSVNIVSLPIEYVDRYNPLKHQMENVLKVYGASPDDIYSRYGGDKGLQLVNKLIIKDSSHEEKTLNFAWEYNIPIQQSYIYDNKFIFGMPYRFQMKDVVIKVSKKCSTCNKTKVIYEYYSLNEDQEIQPESQGIILYQTKCANCNQILYTNSNSINIKNYTLYFSVISEADIESITEKQLVPVLIESPIKQAILDQIEVSFQNEIPEEKALMRDWLKKFFSPIVMDMNRTAFDIEVYVPKKDVFPIVSEAEYAISDISFYDINGVKNVFLLKVWSQEGEPIKNMLSDINYHIYEVKEEKRMLLDVFAFLKKIPILVDFNGTNFDIPYMYYRAVKIGIPKENIPFYVRPSKIPNTFYCTLKWNCIHFDLFLLFSNRSLKIYAFDNKYEDNSLGDITSALLPNNETKVNEELVHPNFELHCIFPKCNIKYYSNNFGQLWFSDQENKIPITIPIKDEAYICPACQNELDLIKQKKKINEYTKNELVYYCLNDAKITMELTRYSDFIVMKLVFIIMRLSNTGFEDFLTHQISHWLKNIFDDYHRNNNILIPQKSEIEQITSVSTQSMTKGKQFEGAIVIDPKRGVHFDVTCTDFASLYPSIIKTRNLSYETVDNCQHEECQKNIVPQTNHWVCNKFVGIIALILGTVRDYRVLYFKTTMKNNKNLMKQYKKEGKDNLIAELQELNVFFDVLQSALKVFINAGYGVIAFSQFHYFQVGMGESVTAYGRDSTASVVNEAETVIKKEVIYGDTDSVFIKQINEKELGYLMDWALKTIHVPLAVDYELKLMAISDRKKNYIGFFKQPKDKEGKDILPTDPLWKSPLIKGLKGKKSNTPPFIRDLFAKLINKLDTMLYSPNDLDTAKIYMKQYLQTIAQNIVNEMIPLSKMVFTQQLSKNIIDYGTADTIEYNKKLIAKAKQGKLVSDNKISLNFALKPQSQKQDEPPIIQAYKMFKTKGMHQAVKCGLLLMQKGMDIVKGYRLKFIKTNKSSTNDGALPLELVSLWSKVNKPVYLDELRTTFGQLYDCFELNADAIVNNCISSLQNGVDIVEIMNKYQKEQLDLEYAKEITGNKRVLDTEEENDENVMSPSYDDVINAPIDVKVKVIDCAEKPKKPKPINSLKGFVKKKGEK